MSASYLGWVIVGRVHGIGVPVAIAVIPLTNGGLTLLGARLRFAVLQNRFGGNNRPGFCCTRLGHGGWTGGRGHGVTGGGGGAAFQL